METGSWIGVTTLASIACGAVGLLAGRSLAPERVVERRVEVPAQVVALPTAAAASGQGEIDRRAIDDESRKLVVAMADTLDAVADSLSDKQIAELESLLSRPPAPLKPEAALLIREKLDSLRRLRDDLRFGSRKALLRLSESLEGIDLDMERIANQATRDLERAGEDAAAKILGPLGQEFRTRARGGRDGRK